MNPQLMFEGEDGVKKLTQDEKKYIQKYVEDIYHDKKRDLERVRDKEWKDYWKKTKTDEQQKIFKEKDLDKLSEEYNKILARFQSVYDGYGSSRYEGVKEPAQFRGSKLGIDDLVEIQEDIPEEWNHETKRSEPKYEKSVYGRAKQAFLKDNEPEKRLQKLHLHYQEFVESIIFAGKKSVFDALQELKAL